MKKAYKHRYNLKCTFVTMQMKTAMLLVLWGQQGWVGLGAGLM